MKQKCFSACLLLFAITLLALGCGGGGSSGTSLSSSWLGVTDPNAADQWQIEVNPSMVAVKPGQTISLSVLLKDAYGHPLNDVKLLFASQLGGTFEDKSVDTVKGWASNMFTAGNQPGTDAIIVMAKETSVSKPILVQAATSVSPVISLTTSSDSTLADNPITVVTGVSVDGVAANDLEVKLSSTIKGDFGSESGKVENGWFSTTFKPDTGVAAGVGTITAMVNGAKAEKTIAVVTQKIAAPQLSISVNPAAVFQGQTASVIVIAKDEAGSGSTANVFLSCTLEGKFNPQSGTPEGGVFFSEFTAEKEVGVATITVTSGLSSASAMLSIEKPEIAMNVTPSKTSVKVSERVPVSVLVTDTYSRPIENASVYLSAELGCYCSPDEGKTNDDGYMFFEFIASKTAGISNIHALTAGATGTAQITVVGP